MVVVGASFSCAGALRSDDSHIDQVRDGSWGAKSGALLYKTASGEFVLCEGLNEDFVWSRGDLLKLQNDMANPGWRRSIMLFASLAKLTAFLNRVPELSVRSGDPEIVATSGGELVLPDQRTVDALSRR